MEREGIRRKDLILTIATRYPYYKLDPFVRTLGETRFDGDLVIFYEKLDNSAIERLKKNNVQLIKFDASKFKSEGIPVFHYRFYLFRDFLKNNLSKYKSVFIADMRDIVFQKNPFDHDSYASINFFLEEQKFSQSNINYFVLRAIGGSKFAEAHKEDFVSCAGTTIGESKVILNYLKIMSARLGKSLPFDQGLHNYLIYSQKFKNSHIFHNFNSPVFTFKKRIPSQNKNGQLINKDGSVINILHQYDRTYSLMWKFNSFRFFIRNFISSISIKLKRQIKIILFNLPLAGRYFKNKYFDPTQFN